MAGGGYRGILAAVPSTQRLRSASGKGAKDQDQKPKQQQDQQLREQARSHKKSEHIQNQSHPLFFSPLYRPSVSSPAAFDLDAPPPREAEWRFCAVGNPAWMPG
jgi:hypothetical protein